MTPRRFAWLLRAKGPDLACWPVGDREAALALLRLDAGSRVLLADTMSEEPDAIRLADTGVDTVASSRMLAVIRTALLPATGAMRAVRWGTLAACVLAGAYLGIVTASEPDIAGWPASTIEASPPATVLAALDQ